jgi:serine protease Do
MFWKKTGPVCIIAAVLAIVAYGQTTRPRARSANLQGNSGYLGVGVWDVTPEIAKTFGLKDASGLLVTAVDGEAVRAGIHVHDVIVEFNGQKVTNGDDFTNSIIGKAPGTKINLIILRGNTKQNLTATLGNRPPGLPIHPSVPLGIADRLSPEDMQMAIAAANAVPTPRLGFYVVEMMPQLSAFFGAQEGLLVESVTPGTPAEKSGLKAGDVITKVNGIPVSTEREIVGIVRQTGSKVVSFTVFRNKKQLTLSLEVAWNRDSFNRDEVN